MKKYWTGIDNGTSGSIGVVCSDGTSAFIETPIIKCKSYTKKDQNITRINWRELLENIPKGAIVMLERPLVNPRMFTATQSALRSLEATLIVLEMLDIEPIMVDSKSWQSMFISSAVIGHDAMKKASMEVGLRLFPSNGMFIKKHGDADGLLLAEFCRLKHIEL